MFTGSLARNAQRLLVISAALFAVAAPWVQAQSVPVPFAGLLAGGGTVCSTSLPIYTPTGTGAKYGDGCPATQATLNTPVSVATDSFGNVFIADQNDYLVRVVYNGGTALAAAIIAANPQFTGLVPQKGYIYTIAGGVPANGPTQSKPYCNQNGSGIMGSDTELDGCPGAETYQQPRGLALDTDGNLFISSVAAGDNLRVLYVSGTKAAALITQQNPSVITPQVGYVYSIAGTGATTLLTVGAKCSSTSTLVTTDVLGDGCLASQAIVNTPRGIVVDSSENIYFADQLDDVVRFISSSSGIITTLAGHCAVSNSSCTATTTSGDGSAATSTAVNIDTPYAVALDTKGNLFIAESGTSSLAGRIRVVYAAGTLPGITGPTVGDIYTYAGGASGTTPAQLATFQEVFGVSIDNSGYLYVTDYRTASSGSNKLWRVDPTNGNIATIAGNSGTAVLTVGAHCNGGTNGPVTADKYGDGCPATQAYLQNPQESLAFTANGSFYVADRMNNLVRSFTYNNVFPNTAVGSNVTQPLAFLYAAGSDPLTETFTTQGSTTTDYSDGGGDTCALGTTLTPATTCVDYVKFSPATAGQRTGSITVTSATATVGTQTLSGVGINPVLTISPPTAVALGTGITPVGISSDQLGNVNISDSKGKQVLRTTIAGGTPTALITLLGFPRQTTTDAYGDVFVADSLNNNIVEHTAAGATVTLGSGLSGPQGIAADLFGNLYIADTGNNRLVYLSPFTGNQRIVPVSGYTLSAPSSLALDAAGDLYIIDTNNTRVIELPFGSSPQAFTVPTGVTPAAIAFDSAGDAYLADTTSGDILFVPAGSSAGTALLTGFTTPAGVAVGANGNVFVADSAASSSTATPAATGYNVALNASVFATTNIQLTSLPITLTLADVGNATATLSTPPYVETGSVSAFPSYGTPTCTAGYALTPGSTCTQAFDFAPTVPGPQSARVVFSTTSGQSTTANLSGTATNLILTSTTISPLNATSNYGLTVTYTVTMTPASTGASTPGGTISFVVDGTTVSTQNVTSSPYVYTFTLSTTVATHSVAASYSGDAIYAGSHASTLLTVNKAVTSTTASYSQNSAGTLLSAVMTPASVGALTFTGNVYFYVDNTLKATVPVGNGTVSTTLLIADGSHTYYAMYGGDANYAASSSTSAGLVVSRAATTTTLTILPVSNNGVGGLQLSAQVTSLVTGTPSGTVVFTNGTSGTPLATVNLSTAVNGTVTFTTTTTSYTNYSFTASYSGDGLYDPSSSTVTEGADFVVVAPAATLGIPDGTQQVEPITVTPIHGYTGTLTATCSNLPANVLCRFLPTPVVLSTTSSVTLSVQVFVGVNPLTGSLSGPSVRPSLYTWLALLLMAPLSFGLRRRKGTRALALPTLLALALLAVLSSALMGCGANKTPAYSESTYKTPDGTYPITVTLTDTNNVSRSAVFNILVTGN